MFGSNKKKQPAATNNSAPVVRTTSTQSSTTTSAINSIGQGTKIEGTITSDSDIRVDGELNGTLNCKGRLIIGPKGSIDGNIDCRNAVIEGKFKGTLHVVELLNVKESAHIDGEVSTGQLVVHSGANFNVSCATGSQKGNGKSTGKAEKILSFAKN